MSYLNKMILPDGQELQLYSDGNTNAGLIRMNGSSLLLSGSGTDILISNGNNLVFGGASATIGGTSSIISLGFSGDTIAMDVSGVTYRLPVVEGSFRTTGSITIDGGSLTLGKSGSWSTINFSAQTNDPGFIKHYENNNVSYMQFSVSDDIIDTDYFSFGATPGGTFQEKARITASGKATFVEMTSSENASVGGNLTVTGSIFLPRSGSEKEMLKIGAVAFGQHDSDNQLLITGLGQLRFGDASSATWDYNKWAGIKYDSTNNRLIIGGPASSAFSSNASPPLIEVSFEGVYLFKSSGNMLITGNGDTLSLYGTDHSYIQFYPQGVGGGRFAWIGYGRSGTNTLTIRNEKASGDLVLSTNGGKYGFNTTNTVALFTFSNNGGTGQAWYVDVGNYAGTQTLFEHTGSATPVPFELRKSGYTGTDSTYGLLHLHMHHNAAGVGSNLYFTMNNASGSKVEYGGIGAIIDANTAGSETGHLVFYTAKRVERMRIKSNGNVGIGTNNPSYTLHVNGDAQFDGWVRVTGQRGIYFQDYGGGFYMTDTTWIRTYNNKSFYHNSGTMRTDGTFQVGNNGDTLNVVNGGNFAYRTNTLFANTSGQVAIGTTTPAPDAKLQINTDKKSGLYLLNTNTTGNAGLEIRQGTDWANIYIENYDGDTGNRLVISMADDGDQDYILFRSIHFQDPPVDQMELRRTHIKSLLRHYMDGGIDVRTSANFQTSINMNNNDINSVNTLKIASPGKGIEWLGKNIWKLYETNDVNGDMVLTVGSVPSAKLTISSAGNITMAGGSVGIKKINHLYFDWNGAYGTDDYHAITSKSSDNLWINSYNNIYVNIDTNNNNSPSRFQIGIHSTAESNTLFYVEDNLTWSGNKTQISLLNDSNDDYLLELYKPQGTAARPISIRFHQGNRYWGRILFDGAFKFVSGDNMNWTDVQTGNLAVNGRLTTWGLTHVLGTSATGASWDSADFNAFTTLRFQNHLRFWVGAGNATWYTGTATANHHDLLITTHNSDTVTRGITFASQTSDTGRGYRLGRWFSGTSSATSSLVVDGKFYVKSGSGFGTEATTTPTISLAIGDNDTGFDWVSDGVFRIMNNSSERVRFNTGDVTFSTHVYNSSSHFSLAAANGLGYRFWNSDSYKIHMSTSTDGSWGGRLPWIPTDTSGADYNMYFRMEGNNRGWAFRNDAKGGVNAQITGDGQFHSKKGFRAGYAGMEWNEAEQSLDFIFYS